DWVPRSPVPYTSLVASARETAVSVIDAADVRRTERVRCSPFAADPGCFAVELEDKFTTKESKWLTSNFWPKPALRSGRAQRAASAAPAAAPRSPTARA